MLDINQCLNEKNEIFYNENIKPYTNITLENNIKDNNIWEVSFTSNSTDIIIKAGNDFPNVESFSHEMLHIYLFLNGFNCCYIDYLPFYRQLCSNICMINETICGIANAISHYKMLPIYIDILKMDKIKFCSDWDPKITDADLLNLRSSMYDKKIDSCNFTKFIRFYFNSRYNFSDELNNKFSVYQKELKSKDAVLYGILENCCNGWDNSNDYKNSKFFIQLYSNLTKYLSDHV